MRFSDWLNELIHRLKLKNIDIARSSGIHPSTISRYRTGVQTPSDRLLKKLTVGLCREAAERNQSSLLHLIVSKHFFYDRNLFFPIPFTENIVLAQGIIKTDLLNIVYFSAKETLKDHLEDYSDELTHYIINFDQKLDYLMTLFSVSNSWLANSLNLDSSLISRWRSGMRTPKTDHPSIKDIACTFAKIIDQSQKKCLNKKQEHFIDYLSSILLENIEEALYHWLLSHQGEEEIVQQSVNAILDQISMWQTQSSEQLKIDPEYFTELEINRQQTIYHNLSGLREAVLRFLTDIVLSSTQHRLLLFSNQDLSWLMTDRSFLETWEILMKTILFQGHQIEIIHHLGRSPKEITLGIEKWLPMHLSGNIRPFTCDDLNIAENNPLIKTMFIDADHAAISGELISGMENQSIYHYYTSVRKIKDLVKQFEQLKQSSRPILTTHKDNTSFFDEFRRALQRMQANDKTNKDKIMILSDAVPLYLFAPDTLQQVLLDNNMSHAKIDIVFHYYAEIADIIKNHLKSGELYLIGTFRHFFEKGHTLKLQGLLTNESIEVSETQYNNALIALRKMVGNYEHFHLIDLELSPFDNLHIFSLANQAVYIHKFGEPQVLVELEHQYSIDSLNRFLVMLISKGDALF